MPFFLPSYTLIPFLNTLLIRNHLLYLYSKKSQMDHSSDQLVEIFLSKNHAKEPKELAKFLHLTFSNPNILISKMETLSKQPFKNESGLDVESILRIYQNIKLHGQIQQLSSIYKRSLDEINLLPDIRSFVKDANTMKYFVILALWGHIFTDNELLLKMIQVVNKASYYNDIFIGWLTDLPLDHLKCIVSQLIKMIDNLTKKYSQNITNLEANNESFTNKSSVSQAITQQLGRKATFVCNYLKLLYLSNKKKQRIPVTEFNSQVITTVIDPLQTFRKNIQKNPYFNFLTFPFLLSCDYKFKLVQIESIYEQKINIKKNLESGLTTLLENMDFNHGVHGLIFLFITVSRNNILDDSMEKLGKIKGNLKSPLKIEFIGQEGADEGGVRNQYFSLITKAIFNPYLDMFLPKNGGRFYWFNGFSFQIPLRFEFVGMLLGLSIYNAVHLDFHFPQIVYKKILNKRYEQDYGIEIIQDLKQIEPDVYRTLKDILTTTENVQDIELYFNIELQYFGDRVIEQLVEDGSMTKVNNQNRQYYCLLYADYLLNKHIAKQFAPFRKGFYKVVSGSMIETMEPEQLRILISGIEQINMKQLDQSSQYEGGYTRNTPVIENFWEFLHTLDHQQKKNFLTFITGTDRVPIDGLKSLKFTIQRHSNTKNLPTAHTCFNVLLLPEYESKQTLIKNMRLILQHNQGFGLI